ncbi:hypothetical protein [Youngiibacter multivorans]|uniref:DUF1492 domain-containing protein n=1 Tax=Youngiibacter multivorans TaxID=937251 RepID=A0ABS4G751_9CLOT|nr:hypothetical protein [Youngiibacter multivorans]MBP1920398.1 hypothetical protein [Youngiibacter multivorans]
MDVREYFEQANLLNRKIKMMLNQVETLDTQAKKVTSSFQMDKVSSSKQKSSMENVIVRKLELEKEINAQIDELYALKLNMALVISRIDDERYRRLLELRYIEGEEWNQIAITLGYNMRWVQKLHKRSIEEAANVYDGEAKNTNDKIGRLEAAKKPPIGRYEIPKSYDTVKM